MGLLVKLALAYWAWTAIRQAPAVPGGSQGGKVGKLTDRQVAELAYAAGWRDDELVTATRIALGESGGNPSAKNPASSATGLWQIIASLHPGVDLVDPVANAKLAKAMHDKVGWKPWKGPTELHTKRHTHFGHADDQLVADVDLIQRAKTATVGLA